MRNLIITGTLAASLAFGANTAMAAAPQAHKPATALQLTRAQTAHVASFGGWGSAQSAGTGWGWGGAQTVQAGAYGGWQGGRYAGGVSLPRNQLGLDVSQFIQGMLGGGPAPYANLARDVERMRGVRGGGSYDYSSPGYDNSATIATGNDAQAASDAENQAIQQMNDTNALTASMAAAEEQNDEANAATLQTEINAGM
jgi:hypothetical protein